MNPVPAPTASRPWYRHAWVWMLIAGPALVVVAAVFTAYLAMRDPDPVLANDAYEYGQKDTQAAQRQLMRGGKPHHARTNNRDVFCCHDL